MIKNKPVFLAYSVIICFLFTLSLFIYNGYYEIISIQQEYGILSSYLYSLFYITFLLIILGYIINKLLLIDINKNIKNYNHFGKIVSLKTYKEKLFVFYEITIKTYDEKECVITIKSIFIDFYKELLKFKQNDTVYFNTKSNYVALNQMTEDRVITLKNLLNIKNLSFLDTVVIKAQQIKWK